MVHEAERTDIGDNIPVSDQLGFLRLDAGQVTYQCEVRYLRASPADLKHGNGRQIIAELGPRSGRRAAEAPDENERKTARYHYETYSHNTAHVSC